jgi:hypothetical protein
LCGFGLAFAFVATTDGVGVDVAVAVGEATADARAEALAIGEVLLAGVDFPPPSTIPMMINTMTPTTARPILFCFFFIGGPPDGPPLSA